MSLIGQRMDPLMMEQMSISSQLIHELEKQVKLLKQLNDALHAENVNLKRMMDLSLGDE